MAGVEELPPQPFAYMLLVAGGAALPYNLRDAEGRPIDGVRLTGPLVAQMFTGQIHTWRDPAILAAQADNVAARLPDLPVRRVVPTATAPSGMPRPGTRSRAGFRSSSWRTRPAPSPCRLRATWRWHSWRQRRTRTAPRTSPRCSRASVPRPIPSRRTAMRSCRRRASAPTRGSTLGKFLTYALTRGQDKMAPLGYSPLPPNLVQQGFGVIRQIAGAPDPGPLGDWGQQ